MDVYVEDMTWGKFENMFKTRNVILKFYISFQTPKQIYNIISNVMDGGK